LRRGVPTRVLGPYTVRRAIAEVLTGAVTQSNLCGWLRPRYIWPVRVFRIALRVSIALIALGFLGVAAGIATLTITCPAGCPQLTSPPAPILVAVGAFVVGVVGAVVFSGLIMGRQPANPARPQPVLTGINGSIDPKGVGDGAPAQFRPMGLGLRRGVMPTSSSIPWAQHFMIHADGLEMRNLFDRAWVPRDRIIGLYRMPGAIRVIWEDGDCTGTVTDWFGIKKIADAMEQAGYRFDAN
jgi:hypothetical protein